jgi:aldehyde dehydrogenase (NAD+)
MTSIEMIPDVVDRVRRGYEAGLLRERASRISQLQQLRRMLLDEEDLWLEALRTDLGKPTTEAYVADIAFVVNEIDHALAHLDRWIKPRRVKMPLPLRPGTARIQPEPLGSVCIIAPWNYPVQLLFGPLVPALAAGNSAVLKPSEVVPSVDALVEELVPKYLDERLVAVVNGGVDETSALLEERFDHIFFTGNGTVGRIVMAAAAKHLTPVTLELGGKSPAIVTSDADLPVAAKRIAWGKFLNAGQTCVAPDYVLVEEAVEAEFVRALTDAITTFYGDDPEQSEHYARIVDARHHDRLVGLLDAGGYDATAAGGTGNRDSNYLAPTVLCGVKPDAPVMQDEIFGPILPVLSVEDVDEAIRFVNDRDKPLALYAFTSNERTQERIVAHTSSGAVTVNHAVIHPAIPELPFGGVGASGMGAYHGTTGFDLFSHDKGIVVKPTRPDPSVMYPPYSNWKQRLTRRFA